MSGQLKEWLHARTIRHAEQNMGFRCVLGVVVAPLSPLGTSARGARLHLARTCDLLPKGRDSPRCPQAGRKNEPAGGIPSRLSAPRTALLRRRRTTEPQTGVGADDPPEFVEEIQVKPAYTAESRPTGGVINVVTKSGTNLWRGPCS